MLLIKGCVKTPPIEFPYITGYLIPNLRHAGDPLHQQAMVWPP